MNDEEKKAIKEVKHFNELTRYWQEEEYEEKEIAEYITTILNLIEKQQKEIKELQVINQMQKYRIEVMDPRELISRDEVKNIIKAKIEELYETKQYWNNEVIKILQSILDKIKGDDK